MGLRTALIALAGAALVALGGALPANAQGCANADLEPTSRNAEKLADAILCLLNQERAERGLKPLAEERRLLRAGARHSDDMVERRYFSHVSPEGRDLIDRTRAVGYLPKEGLWRVAENLAWGTGSYGSPRHVVKSWMDSPAHRRNVLDGSLRHAGVGVSEGTPRGRRGATFTLVLGRR